MLRVLLFVKGYTASRSTRILTGNVAMPMPQCIAQWQIRCAYATAPPSWLGTCTRTTAIASQTCRCAGGAAERLGGWALVVASS